MKYFSYARDTGFALHDTQKEATGCAEESLTYYRLTACDGWNSDASQICWGVVHGQATVSPQQDGALQPGGDFIDYVLKEVTDGAPVYHALVTPCAGVTLTPDRRLAGQPDPEALKPGVELDHMIAEKVMG